VSLPLVGLSPGSKNRLWEAILEPVYAALVALPLYVLPWLAGAVSAGSLTRGALAVCVYGALLALGGHLIDSRVRSETVSRIAKPCGTILLAALAWAHRGAWLGWLRLG
jgi:hypothetical protein